MDESKRFTQNTSILVSGEFVSFLLSFGLTFFLVRFLTIDEYSFFNRILVVPIILLYISDFGLFHGCLYYLPRLDKLKKKQKSRNVIIITLISKSLIGIILFSIFFFISPELISPIIGIQETHEIVMLQLISIILITKHLLEAIRAVLIGSNKMIPFVTLKIIENGSNFLLTIFFFLINWKLLGPIFGLVISTIITAIFGISYINKRLLKKVEKKQALNWKCAPILIERGFLYSLNAAIINTKNEFFILFLTLFNFYSEVSYLRVGVSITIFFHLFLRPVRTSIFPIFSKYSWDNYKEKTTLTRIFHSSIKFSHLFITPVIVFCIIFASELIPLIFGLKYLASSYFISIFLISYLPLTFGMLAIPPFLFGQGHPRFAFLIDFVSLIASILFGISFSFFLGSLGFVIGISLGAFLGIIFGIFAINRKFGKELFSNNKRSILILVIAVLLCGFLFIIFNFLTQMLILENFLLKLLILGLIFVCYYLLFLIILIQTKLIRYEEMTFLIQGFQKIPVINRILHFIAILAKKILRKKNN